jgi:hypothetical protein
MQRRRVQYNQFGLDNLNANDGSVVLGDGVGGDGKGVGEVAVEVDGTPVGVGRGDEETEVLGDED